MPHGKCAQPGIDLSEGILLPLLRAAIPEHLGILHEATHACRAEPIHGIELAGDEPIAGRSAGVVEQRATSLRKRLRPPGSCTRRT